MFDDQGHVKLTDFGMIKLLLKQDDSDYIRDILEYMAPETLIEDKATHCSDWWSLGIIFYQMLFGKLPYQSDSVHEIFATITKSEIFIPEDMCSKNARDLLSKMLVKNPKKRIGKEDANEIMAHPFFDNINWHDVLH